MPRSVLLNFFGIVTGGIIYSYYSDYSFMAKSFRMEYGSQLLKVYMYFILSFFQR